MVAAAVAALLWLPVRERLTDVATQRVYGERHAPEEVLRTFGSRLTRALPLDELLLQLAESLKKTMLLSVAEVWTRGTGRPRARRVGAGMRARPARGRRGRESVIARAGVSGAAWARIWLPAILAGEDDEVLRSRQSPTPASCSGMIVAAGRGALQFSEADDQALTELPRQVGLALHNVKLDSALQESLDEVRRQADELRGSRAASSKPATRSGGPSSATSTTAPSSISSPAVNMNLAHQLADTDPDTTKEILEQIGHELQDAVQELRNLAHGNYPPLLMDRGLPEALSAAASRAALPTALVADDIGRYSPRSRRPSTSVASKRSRTRRSTRARVPRRRITVHEEEGTLLFVVSDDGAGFDLSSGTQRGHGFVNMSDRVGAIGGSIVVESAPARARGSPVGSRSPVPEARPSATPCCVGPKRRGRASGPNSSLWTYAAAPQSTGVGGRSAAW